MWYTITRRAQWHFPSRPSIKMTIKSIKSQSNLFWKTHYLDNEFTPPPNMFQGNGSLKPQVIERFFGFSRCMCSLWWNDVGFFWISTLRWNHYLMSNLNQEGFYGGSMVITISKIEVVNFLGVILKMSNDNWWLDRYVSYF